MPRPRGPAQVRGPEFHATRARLDALIHPPTEGDEPRDFGAAGVVTRLTIAGDDVE